MNKPTKQKEADLAALFHEDETAWLERSARLIKKRRYRELDYAHLQEYLLDMAERDKREVRSRVLQLLIHLLKWEYQPRRRTRSWKNTILNQREELGELLQKKSLRSHAEERLEEVYRKAVKRALRETELPADTIPEKCPFSLSFLLGEDFPS